MLQFEMRNTQVATLTAVPTTLDDKPASIDGQLKGELVDGEGEVTAGPDDLSIVYTPPADFVGTVNLKASGDADLGEGVVTIEDLIVINVVGEQAKNLGMKVDLKDK